jgi:DNA-binding helix-hairpin-helix protein with protein kinase domain
MKVTLATGGSISCEDESFASGANGTVYRSTDGQYAVKLYTKTTSNYDALHKIVDELNPFRHLPSSVQQRVARVLAWPVAVVAKPRPGVVLPLIVGRLKLACVTNLRWRRREPEAMAGCTFRSHLRMCLDLATALHLIQNSGLSHTDLSDNNVIVDPVSGEATLLDLDGLAINGVIPPTVIGTRRFPAPEIVCGNGRVLPTIATDKHALAVLMYLTLLLRHPLEGRRRVPELTAEEHDLLTYGSSPLYVEHPTDESNRPAGRYVPSSALGPHLHRLFQRAFVDGLTCPEERPLPAEWHSALLATADLLVPCPEPTCEMKWFVMTDRANRVCPWCQRGRLNEDHIFALRFLGMQSSGQFRMPSAASRRLTLIAGSPRSISGWHLGSLENSPGPWDQPEVLRLEPTSDPQALLLRNTCADYLVAHSEAGVRYIPMGKKMRVGAGTIVEVGMGDRVRLVVIEREALV